MPIINKIESEKNTILVWEITETLEEIIALGEGIDTSNYTSKKRKKEHLASRLLVNKIYPTKIIIYNEFGAPELNNGKHISISHSKELVAVIFSDKKTGLDIEQISEKSLRIASKFVSEKNLIRLNKEKATLIWCIKEAIYKWYQKGEVDFIKDIIIPEFFAKKHGSVTAYFRKKKLNLNYLKINNHYLVYVCN
jgi:4'-phosphopantetheinyl transferase